ncbi:MAG: hypothetical protein NT067_04455 [Candidatus Diapherotrites archaeon]|nr:hypothetical protein [Candidatus Diapherotrites archaeon]
MQAATADYAYLVDFTGTSFLPSTLYAGDVASVKIDLKNKGSGTPVTDLNSVLDLGNQFELVQAAESIDMLQPGQTKTLIFRFKVKEDTLPGYYPAFLTLSYTRGTDSSEQTYSFSVPVSKSEKKIDVTVEPKAINPGNQSELVFSLKNVGGSQISNLSFSWSEENNLVLPLGSDNKRYVSAIEAGETAKLTYIVAADPNITTGIYPLDLEMTFMDVNGIKTQTSQVGLIVGGGTDFEVSADLASGQLSLSIANIGSNNAEAVVVRVPKQNGINISGSTISILGNLNKGDFTVASFTVQTSTQASALATTGQTAASGTTPAGGQMPAGNGFQGQTATGDTNAARSRQFDRNNAQVQSVTIEIDYTDTTGERQTAEKTVSLSQASTVSSLDATTALRSRTSSQAISPWMVLSAIFGLALIAGTIKSDRKNLKKLIAVLVVAVGLFLAVVYYLNSDQTYMLVAGAVSIALFALYFLKLRRAG